MFQRKDIQVLYNQQQLDQIISTVAERLNSDYAHNHSGDPLIVIILLKGSLLFASDLIRKLDVDIIVEFMTVRSYVANQSSGNVEIIQDLHCDIFGKDVVIIEDIIDTGLTLNKVIRLLEHRQPRTLEICTLLEKPHKRQPGSPQAKYVGKEIPECFVVGYGLDVEQRLRHLPFLGYVEIDT